MKKTVISLAFLMVLSSVLIGCSQSPATNNTTATTKATATTTATTTAATTAVSEAPKTDKVLKFTLIPQSMSNPFFVTMEEGANQAVKDFAAKGIIIELSVQAPELETDAEKQLQLIENAITAKADAIMFPAISPTALIPGIKKANDAGIKVINIDAAVDFDAVKAAGAKIVTYIGSDNTEGGRIAGEAMGKFFEGKGDVEIAVIEGLPGHINAEARKAGFLEGIAKYPNLKVVASQTANWSMDEAYTVVQNMLQANPNIKGIFGCSDQMTLGGISAAAAAGKSDQITFISFDATDDGRAAIKDGKMFGSVAQYPYDMGYKAVETAVDAVTNPDKVFPDKIATKVELITKDNL